MSATASPWARTLPARGYDLAWEDWSAGLSGALAARAATVPEAEVHVSDDVPPPEARRSPQDAAPAPDAVSVVDWGRTARRLRLQLVVVGGVVVVVWLVVGFGRGGPTLRLLGELVGFGLLAAFVVEVVVVGGAALRGLFRAGERGERLAGGDVSLLPPQLTRRRRR